MPVGPPIPEDAGDDLVGPAVPPEEAGGEAGDAWDGRGMGEPDEQEDPYRLPVTSEVALEGTHVHLRHSLTWREMPPSAFLIPQA